MMEQAEIKDFLTIVSEAHGISIEEVVKELKRFQDEETREDVARAERCLLDLTKRDRKRRRRSRTNETDTTISTAA